MLDRLLERFRVLDEMHEGCLDIGIDVPSASQVDGVRAKSFFSADIGSVRDQI